jgi:hypothetical protein
MQGGAHGVLKEHQAQPVGTLKLVGIAAVFFVISVCVLRRGRCIEVGMISE